MFCEYVKSIRRNMGLSQSQFAALLGVDTSLISHWENGRRGVTGDTAQRVRRAYLRGGPRAEAIGELYIVMQAALDQAA